MKERFLIYFFACTLIQTAGSCQKRRPPKGDYLCTFRYDSGGSEQTGQYRIVESNKNYIVLHSATMGIYGSVDTLFKLDEKNKVEGTLGGFGSYYPFEVTGTVKRDDGFKFKIEGSFTHLVGSQGSGLTYNTGTFVLTKD